MSFEKGSWRHGQVIKVGRGLLAEAQIACMRLSSSRGQLEIGGMGMRRGGVGGKCWAGRELAFSCLRRTASL